MLVNYIPVENIISSAKLKLKSYESAGLLDEASMLSDAFYVIKNCGYSLEEHKKLVLDIYDYKVNVPEDIVFVESLYKTTCSSSSRKKTTRFYYGLPHTFQVLDNYQKFCYHKCELEEKREQITRTIYLDKEEYTDSFSGKELLEFRSDVPTTLIKEDCPNYYCTSDKYFTIKDNIFYFNFEEGSILLTYTGRKLDSDGFILVEEDEYLIKAIEDYLIFRQLETIYYNSEADVLQRLQYAKQESLISLDTARIQRKIPSVASMRKYGKAKSQSLQKLNLKGYADW